MQKSIIVLLIAIVSTFSMSCGSQKSAAKKHKDLVKTYETLKKELAEADVTMIGEEVKIVLPEAILFEVNSSEISKDYTNVFSKMASIFNKYPQTNILVNGHTDNSGSDKLNETLSMQRAEAAKSVLVDNKVKADRIYTWGLGKRNPIADNKTIEGRKQNRRVEVIVLYDYKAQ